MIVDGVDILRVVCLIGRIEDGIEIPGEGDRNRERRDRSGTLDRDLGGEARRCRLFWLVDDMDKVRNLVGEESNCDLDQGKLGLQAGCGNRYALLDRSCSGNGEEMGSFRHDDLR
ncbi:hypothetical protein MFRU_012g01700 [Monilinia fructicola]|nr:hypothetical protein MFRU_012g01700 [Monilinia fructicola]